MMMTLKKMTILKKMMELMTLIKIKATIRAQFGTKVVEFLRKIKILFSLSQRATLLSMENLDLKNYQILKMLPLII